MPLLSVTNSGSYDTRVTDPSGLTSATLYIPAGQTKTLAVESVVLERMAPQLQALVTAATATYSVSDDTGKDDVLDALSPPGPTKQAAVAATALESDWFMIRKTFTAGAGGSADDVTVYTNVPYKLRVLDVTLITTTAVGASTCTLRTAITGGGTACTSAISSGSVATARNALTTATVAVATTSGLFIRRSDSGAAGEMLIWARRET